jgi:glycerol-3-phosphate acyltransferase PlsY
VNASELIAVVIASYLIGAIPFGYLVGRALRGIDIREHGSGSSGATNAMRQLGKGPFFAIMFLDALKGYIPVLAVWYLFGAHDLQVASGIAVVVGHDFPIYIGFRGGRGVSSSFGVCAALALPLAVGLMAVGLFLLFSLRYMSVMSIVTVPLGALVLLLLAVFHVHGDFTYTKAIFGAFATAFVLITHLGNIRRLRDGVEPKFDEAGDPIPSQGRRRARAT